MMPLFKSTHDALRFAYNFNGTNVVTATLGIPPGGNGKGLGGLDGAAEAGNIKRIVESLGEKVTAWAVVSFAPSRFPCSCGRSCCKGWRENPEWSEAAIEMAKISFGIKRLSVIRQFFLGNEEKKQVAEIARTESIPKSIAKKLLQETIDFFDGIPPNRGVSQVFEDAIDQQLRKAGIVGEEE